MPWGHEPLLKEEASLRILLLSIVIFPGLRMTSLALEIITPSSTKVV